MISFNEWRQKPWIGKKKDVIKLWQSLPEKPPLVNLRLVPEGHKGSTYNYDSVRITGSSSFINSILSRLRDFLNLDSSKSKLEIVYQQQINSKTQNPVPETYVAHIHVKEKK